MLSSSSPRILGLGQGPNQPNVFSFVVTGKHGRQADNRFNRRLCFQSRVMKEFYDLAEKFAKSSASVLITGESGTGKELFSRLVHEKSPRRDKRFVAINCAALPAPLIESELFGYEKGAFTGAENRRAGFFEKADGGTLLLDEITEIPIEMQAKLLRVIEEQEVQLVGANDTRPIDVRIIATANKHLPSQVAEGKFRQDLFHRISVLGLDIPPLRERVADIPLLTMHFVSLFKTESEHSITQVTKKAIKLLCKYSWPGNVRELKNVIQRACVLSHNGEINDTSLPARILNPEFDSAITQRFQGMKLSDIEKQVILECLRKFNGSKKLAAEELGVTPRTLSNKLKLYKSEPVMKNIGNS